MHGPDIADDDHVRGGERPNVTIVEYGDYDCPHTRRAQSFVDRLLAENDDVRVVFRHFPLRHLHANAEILARVAEAAARQGLFWAMHDHLMRHLAPIDEAGVLADAAHSEIDMDRVRRDVGRDDVARRIERDVSSGRVRGVHSTPSFFFNDALHDGHYDFETLANRLRAARAHVTKETTSPSPGPAPPPVSPAIEEARAPNAILRFEGKRCIHSRNCVLDAPDVFLANVKGPWLHPEAVRVEELVAIAESCPSGAITYERTDGGPPEHAPKVNVVRVRENGPLAVHAAMEIEGRGAMTRATLCRCGASNNKPFCDGAHARVGFTATGEPATQPTDPLPVRDGPLAVVPVLNGPLRVTGNLEICAGTGRTVKRVSSASLCRCGASQNKPFCDGTHAKIGFRSD